MKTEVKWIIEGELWDDGSTERLKVSLAKIGVPCIEISPENARNGMKSLGEKEECIIFYGSLETAKEVLMKKPWIPGAFYTPKNYNCSRYYPVFGKYLLNADRYAIYPYGDLIRMKDVIFAFFSEDRALFIRPDDGEKSFTGRLILKENYEKDVEYCGFYGVSPHTMVVVSAPKNIVSEWRFFVAEGKVITGSQYRQGSLVIYSPDVEEGAMALADETAGLYSPDGVWALDICKTQSGNYYVLEIGCMSCAGLYACDTDKLVETATKIAIKEYKSYQEI